MVDDRHIRRIKCERAKNGDNQKNNIEVIASKSIKQYNLKQTKKTYIMITNKIMGTTFLLKK